MGSAFDAGVGGGEVDGVAAIEVDAGSTCRTEVGVRSGDSGAVLDITYETPPRDVVTHC